MRPDDEAPGAGRPAGKLLQQDAQQRVRGDELMTVALVHEARGARPFVVVEHRRPAAPRIVRRIGEREPPQPGAMG